MRTELVMDDGTGELDRARLSAREADALLTGAGADFELVEELVNDRPVWVWKHGPRTIRDLLAAGRAYGNATFLVLDDDRVSFEAFSRAAAMFADELVARGLRKGDRVAIAMRNLPEWPVAFFGAALAGAIVAPLNAWWTGSELAYALEDSGASFLVADQERMERLRPLLAEVGDLRFVYAVRDGRAEDGEIGGHPRQLTLEAVIGPPRAWSDLDEVALPQIDFHPDDDLTILYTSGTTGRPKGAVGSHRNMLALLPAPALAAARSRLRRGLPPLAATSGPGAVLLSVPFFHVTGCHGALISSFFRGAKIVLMHRWNAEQGVELIRKEGVTSAGGVPTIAFDLVEQAMRSPEATPSLVTVTYGGAPSDGALAARLKQAFPGIVLGTGWGMTETSGTGIAQIAEDYDACPASCGFVLPMCEHRIVADDGSDVPVGGIGELWLRGQNVVRGYWNRPDATAERFVDGWIRSGDLARVDEAGRVFIVDRLSDMIIRGGENIYCVEVENALRAVPQVLDAAVFGVPDPKLGETPFAAVRLPPEASLPVPVIVAALRRQIAGFKIPEGFLLTSDAFPTTASGKIDKRAIRAQVIDEGRHERR